MSDKSKFGIEFRKIFYGNRWSFGACLSHNEVETYLYITLFKWTITIGKFIKYFAK